MKKLVWTPQFIKSAGNFSKRYPEFVNDFKDTIKLMEEDIFHQSLKTHKLKGKLKNFYACSISYSHRIMFQFDKDEQIVLINLGTHDEIY